MCGDYTRCIARIQCTNPECKHEYFRPFSCKKFGICPSCAQKRAILFGEHIVNDVLLKLPHRQFVFTFPKILRFYFRISVACSITTTEASQVLLVLSRAEVWIIFIPQQAEMGRMGICFKTCSSGMEGCTFGIRCMGKE